MPLKYLGNPAAPESPIFGEDWMAGDPGFEPGLTESESAVLPLDESPTDPQASGL